MSRHFPKDPSKQLNLELEAPDKDYVDTVISDESPYVKILGAVTWSDKWECYVAVAQVEGSICVIEVKYKEAA